MIFYIWLWKWASYAPRLRPPKLSLKIHWWLWKVKQHQKKIDPLCQQLQIPQQTPLNESVYILMILLCINILTNPWNSSAVTASTFLGRLYTRCWTLLWGFDWTLVRSGTDVGWSVLDTQDMFWIFSRRMFILPTCFYVPLAFPCKRTVWYLLHHLADCRSGTPGTVLAWQGL